MLNHGGEDELYEQLWKACAGPRVEVPRAGQRVFYFPQGHMEQVCFFSSFHYLNGYKFLFFFLCVWKCVLLWCLEFGYAWFFVFYFCLFYFWLMILFWCFFYFICFLFICVVVVRSINKSGTKSKDSIVQTSNQDPLSCGQCPFTGNFLNYPKFSFLFFLCVILRNQKKKETFFGLYVKKGQMFIWVLKFWVPMTVSNFWSY